ncbi:MAG: hypothetical protein HYX59_01870 [Elusimicrobia bacterium]|nr:hypothetical protein [Elusimicrobiota bacterium]
MGTKVSSVVRLSLKGGALIPEGGTLGEVVVAGGAASIGIIIAGGAVVIFTVNYGLNEMIAAQDKYNDAIDLHRESRPQSIRGRGDFEELDAQEHKTLAPPGRCTKVRWKALDVDAGRKCTRPRSCSDVERFDCVELRLRRQRNEECASARKLIMDECFDGGDDIHKKELQKVLDVLDVCARRITDECP